MAKRKEKPIYQSKRPGFVLAVYPTHVYIKEGMSVLAKEATIPLSNIATIQVKKLTQKLIITTNDGQRHGLPIGGLTKGAQKARDAIQKAQMAALAAPAGPAAPAGQDIPTQIQKLAELRDKGILTADEFEEKKRELLAKM